MGKLETQAQVSIQVKISLDDFSFKKHSSTAQAVTRAIRSCQLEGLGLQLDDCGLWASYRKLYCP